MLTLANKESSVLSGGWDARILVRSAQRLDLCSIPVYSANLPFDRQQWDLNTGVATRNFSAHTGQISSISFRPTSSQDVDPTGASPAASETSSSGGVAASLGKPVASVVDALAKDAAMDDGGSEADADGEEVDDEAMLSAFPLPTTSNGTPTPTLGSLPLNGAGAIYNGILPPMNGAGKAVPVVGSSEAKGLPELSRDVFLSTSIDGQVMIWDRKVKNGAQGAVRRLASDGKNGGWAASVRFLLPRRSLRRARALADLSFLFTNRRLPGPPMANKSTSAAVPPSSRSTTSGTPPAPPRPSKPFVSPPPPAPSRPSPLFPLDDTSSPLRMIMLDFGI